MEVLYQLSYPGEALTIAPGSSARTRTPIRSAGRRRRVRVAIPTASRRVQNAWRATAAAGNSPTSTSTMLVYCEPSS